MIRSIACKSLSHFLAVIRKVVSVMVIIRRKKTARNTGRILKLKWLPKNPNKGDIKVEPI